MTAAQKKKLDEGSPPLARERHKNTGLDCYGLGITPACAGKTQIKEQAKTETGDHPRLRGKDRALSKKIIIYRGSPPLARERLIGSYRLKMRLRITPACAGKTISGSIGENTTQDHPRLRGKDIPF